MTDHNLTFSDGIEPEGEPEETVGPATDQVLTITDNVHVVLRGPDGEVKHEFRGDAV